MNAYLKEINKKKQEKNKTLLYSLLFIPKEKIRRIFLTFFSRTIDQNAETYRTAGSHIRLYYTIVLIDRLFRLANYDTTVII